MRRGRLLFANSLPAATHEQTAQGAAQNRWAATTQAALFWSQRFQGSIQCHWVYCKAAGALPVPPWGAHAHIKTSDC
jgi:hypothetical protein